MELKEEGLMDILVGATVLGCGGGGSLEEGWKLIKKELKKGREFRLVDVDDVPNDKIVASPYYVGSLSGSSRDNLTVRSFRLLEEFLGEKFFGVVSTEMGGHNTAAALATAAELGLPLIDADMAGRAVPELHHSVYYIHGYNMCPFSVVTAYDDKIIFSKAKDDLHAEKLVRSIVKVTGANVGVTSHPIRGKIFKRTIIRNAISLAMDIGRRVRIAKEENKNWVLPLLELGGFLLFKGECVYMKRREGSGFTIGEFELQGIEEFKDESYRILLKNENIASWRNGKIDVTVPDLITTLTLDGEPVINSEIKVGEEYVVLGFKAPKVWRTPKGLEILGPKYFGLNVEYVPIEKRKIKAQKPTHHSRMSVQL